MKIFFNIRHKEIEPELVFLISKEQKKWENRLKATVAKIRSDFIGEISVTFCGHETIQNLNYQYRDIDKSTDVLSFPQLESYDGKFITNPFAGDTLGDLIINIVQAKQQCNLWNNTLQQEISRLFVHGLLHLLGYDHEQGFWRKKKMQYFENKLLRKIWKDS